VTLVSVKTREEAFDLLDGYAVERREELERQHTRRPLVKSYLLETAPHGHAEPSLETVFAKAGCDLKQLDDTLFKIFDANQGKYIGLLEKLIQRHPVIYTTEKSDVMGRWVRKLVASTTALDHLWLSGRAFEELLKTIIKVTPDQRYVRMVFQHENFFDVEESTRFARHTTEASNGDDDESAEMDGEENSGETFEQRFIEESDDDYVPERRKTTFTLTDRLGVIKRLLPQMQELYSPFYSISALRFPAQGRPGGHDFYFDGKVTNRSNSFADHRLHLQFVLRLYKRATETTEQVVCRGVERNKILTGARQQTFVGAPVTLQFQEPLSQEVFDNFIESTFNRPNGKFRLWGNPIFLGPRKAHVYGIDRHLWQPIFLEITDRQIVAIIPQGTCGNSVHRLVTNVQQYLDPGVRVWVGDTDYSELIRTDPDIRSIYDEL